jgi:hypothetical protein
LDCLNVMIGMLGSASSLGSEEKGVNVGKG